MILIGTSGSTKCDWQLLNEAAPFRTFSSIGLNPLFQTDKEIAEEIGNIEELQPYLGEIEVVYFYGAGCSSKKLQTIMERGLNLVFRKTHIYVNQDIVAAALATYEGVKSITALIGTGSNSCSFDGDIVRQEITGIDYVLGDEGSGSYLGKALLRAYLYQLLPEELSKALEAEYNLNKHDILVNVYAKPHANVYLSSFAKFIQNRIDHPFCYDLVKRGFEMYMDLYVCSFSNYAQYKTHFVGSIPHFFEKILREVAEEKNVQVGMVIKEPISRLVQYHINTYYK